MPKHQSRQQPQRRGHQHQACRFWCRRNRRSRRSVPAEDRRRPRIIHRPKLRIRRGGLQRIIRRNHAAHHNIWRRTDNGVRHRWKHRRQLHGGQILRNALIVHWNLADKVDLVQRFLLRRPIVGMRLVPCSPARQRLRTHLVVQVLRKLLLVSAKKMLAVRGCMDAYRTNTNTGNDQ